MWNTLSCICGYHCYLPIIILLLPESQRTSVFELNIRYNPKPDGNCQFTSLCDQLKYKLDVDINHKDLRHKATEYLAQNDALNKGIAEFVSEPWEQ